MTVAELIEALSAVEDKTRIVCAAIRFRHGDNAYTPIEDDLEQLDGEGLGRDYNMILIGIDGEATE